MLPLQYCIDLQDFVKHLTKMEGFKNRMQDIDTIYFFLFFQKSRCLTFILEFLSLKFLSTQLWWSSG
jgi:hypothetical protein